jgi:hypothetical protein
MPRGEVTLIQLKSSVAHLSWIHCYMLDARVEAGLPLSALFQTEGGPAGSRAYDEISGALLLVLRAVTRQPVNFWTERDWVGEASQHRLETEVTISDCKYFTSIFNIF